MSFFPSEYFSFHKHRLLSCPVHINPETELVYVNRGELTVAYEHTDIKLRAGDMAVIAPYRLHGFSADTESDIWIIMFSYRISDDFLKEYGGLEASGILFKPTEKLIAYLSDICKNDDDTPDVFMQKGLFNCFISEYIASCKFSKTQNQRSSLVLKILQYLADRVYSEDITVEDIANTLGSTPSAIRAEFKRYLGISLPRLISNLRLQRAIELMRSEDLSIIEIAYQSGFGSVRTFNRAFRKVYNMTPKEYRAKC